MEAPAKILVVEDDDDLREVLSEILESAGYDTIRAAGYIEAARAIDHAQPDLVLLDIMLPDGDGMEICRRATSPDNGRKPSAVLVISGRNSVECKLKSFLNGAKRFMSKPFESEELVRAVRDMIRFQRIAPATGA